VSIVAEARFGAGFLLRLPKYLRSPVDLAEARAVLEQRLAFRAANFLALVRAVYADAVSPYLALLRHAGCEYGDVERLVGTEGVEGALDVLRREGVYLTVDEFKGRRPVARGVLRLAVTPDQLRNSAMHRHVAAWTGASRGPGTMIPFDLAHVRELAVNRRLLIEARGGREWLHAHWGVPGATGLALALSFTGAGFPLTAWFSQLDPADPALHPRYRWSLRALRLGAWLAGTSLATPVHVPVHEPLPVARWMAQVLDGGRIPHVHTTTSAAVRLCRAASEAGIELRGAQITLGSEPTTTARLAAIRLTGAEGVPNYGAAECGQIAHGCLNPVSPDELHLFHDVHALIAPGTAENDLASPAPLLLTSLLPTAPLLLLNVSLGDEAVATRRECGCPFERLGWTVHLHELRSREKLTGYGMALPDIDVIRILDEVLPARFGGGPTDYQLVEDEAEDGSPRLRLLVHPRLGPLDVAAVGDLFLAALGPGSGTVPTTRLVWRDAGLLRVERRAPLATASGKVLHVHVSSGRGTSRELAPGEETR
jgi:hypothetical protein